MRCLSVRQPWGRCITHHGKRIENRSWRPPESALGARIALHVAKACSPEREHYDLQRLAETGLVQMPAFSLVDQPRGVIIATFRIKCVLWPGDLLRCDIERQHPGLDLRWGDSSQYGWVLEDVLVLDEPVPYTGRQRLFRLEAEFAADLRERPALEAR